MFVHQNQLEFLLPTEAYSSESQFQIERERLFLPGWHPVGTRQDLPRSGDFLTCELFGEHVLVRNFGGTLCAFQNVCAHRHCLLTHEPKGNSEKFRCQYHGWEYDQTGFTRNIPDARCFRPFDREQSHLVKYRLEMLGDVIFVSLAEDGPSLREYLDPYFDHLAERFSAPAWRQKYPWEYDCPSNWKVPAENTLESYHIPHLHASSFGGLYPSEEESSHEMTHRYTALTYNSGEDPRVRTWQARFTRWLGGEATNVYRHFHFHPNLILVTTDVFGYILMYHPTSPRSTRIWLRMFNFRGTKRGIWPACLAWIAGTIGKRTMKQIQLEDLGIFADQQKGLEASRHPGCIGTREERIHAFQGYLLAECGQPSRQGEPAAVP